MMRLINLLLFSLLLAVASNPAYADQDNASSADNAPAEFSALPAAQQQQLQKFANQWPQLTDSQRQRILQGLANWNSMKPEQKQRAAINKRRDGRMGDPPMPGFCKEKQSGA